MTTSRRIFLAHAREDKARVRTLYGDLKARGFDPWLDEVDLVPGQIWKDEIPRAIRQAEVFLACLSTRSVDKRGYVQNEFRLALSAFAERPPGSIYLIPVRLDECDVPESLREIHWVELWQEGGFDRLVNAIKRALERDNSPPQPEGSDKPELWREAGFDRAVSAIKGALQRDNSPPQPGRYEKIKVPHIVIVDDEPEIREMVGDYLSHAGFKISAAQNGAELRGIVETEAVHLVVLDLFMPGEDGLSLARYLRANTKIGVVMLTTADNIVDVIVGLEVGADDYLTKPVDFRELLARVRAVIRRMEWKSERWGEEASAKRVRFGTCQLDVDGQRLYDAAGKEVPITSMEYDLLKAFAEHPNRVLSRDQLLDLAHNRDWEPFDRTIDIRIARLRRKVEADPSKPKVIKTVRGVGYIFVPAG